VIAVTATDTTETDVTLVDLGRIVADPQAWPRQGLDAARVAEFAELYADDDLSVLPPLDVVPDGDALILADGWHRLHALRHIQASQAGVRVIAPTDGDDSRTVAYRHGLTLAASAGLPLTRAERVAAVRRLLVECPEWSDRRIGRAVGVSPTTVGKYRTGVSNLDNAATADTSDTDADTDADDGGSSRPVPTASQAARTLVRGLVRLDDRRGLLARLSDKRAVRSMGAALADALADEYDDPADAVTHARAWSHWLENAITVLEESE
jgi:hypothetical protein